MRLMVVDDHRLVLDGLRSYFRSAMPEVEVAAFDDGNEALATIDGGERYDLIIVDLLMKPLSGIAFMRELKARRNATPVVVVSAYDDPERTATVRKLGAAAFVSKADGAMPLIRTIRTLVQETRAQARGDAPLPAVPKLSGRQTEVLKLAARGLSNRRIGESLGVTEETVKSHLKQIYAELGVNNRVDCVVRASQLGLLPLEF